MDANGPCGPKALETGRFQCCPLVDGRRLRNLLESAIKVLVVASRNHLSAAQQGDHAVTAAQGPTVLYVHEVHDCGAVNPGEQFWA